MACFVRNDSGVREIGDVIHIEHVSGRLEETYGTRVRVLVKGYSGPDDLSGLLVFHDENTFWGVMVGAKLVRVAEVSGVTELTFEALSKDNVNVPIFWTSYENAKRHLSG